MNVADIYPPVEDMRLSPDKTENFATCTILLTAGVSPEGILQDYPYLEKEDIQTVLEFAAAQSDHVMLHAG